jgi:hypothetical protein
MPGDSGVTVVTNARAYYHYTRGCGRIGRPAFPAPSDFRERKVDGKTRAQDAARSRSRAGGNTLFEISILLCAFRVLLKSVKLHNDGIARP